MPGEPNFDGGKMIEPPREESVVYKQAKEIAAMKRELDELRAFKAEVLRGEKRLLVLEHWRRDAKLGTEIPNSRVREASEVFVGPEGSVCFVAKHCDSQSFFESAEALQAFVGRPIVCFHVPKRLPGSKAPEADFAIYEILPSVTNKEPA